MEIEFFTNWFALPGVAAIIVLIINLLKFTPIIKPGQSKNWSTGLNLLGMAILLALRVFKPEANVPEMDSFIGELAAAGTVIVGYIVQLVSSKVFHDLIKGFPVFGKSNSE